MDVPQLETKLAIKLAELQKIKEEIGLIQNTITLLTSTEEDKDCKWLDNILDLIK